MNEQPTADIEYISDPSDFCRQCKGQGFEIDWQGSMRRKITCDRCGGSGSKSVAILPPQAEGAKS